MNGKSHSVEADDPKMPLLYALRNDLGLHAVVPSAISNAVFDALGVRLRSVPFTPEKVKAAMAAA